MSDVRWRCLNGKCNSLEFVAPEPVCPGCKVDARKQRYAAMIQQIETIHFDAPDPVVATMGVGHWACMPEQRVPGTRATGDHSTVNCPACRETAAYKDSYRAPLSQKGPDDAVVTIEKGVLKMTPAG